MTTPTPKPPPRDWEAIERDYRTGAFTDRELGAKYGISHTAIQKKAKKEGWQKDLAGAVKAATQAKLLEAEVAKVASGEVAKRVAKQVANAIPATTEVVAAVAQVNSDVILRHRSDILATRTLAMEMLGELAKLTHSPEDLRALFELTTADMDAATLAMAKQSLGDLLRLHSRVGSVHKLSDTLAKLQAMERKAFGLDEDDKDEGKQGRELTDVERAARVAAILERARAARAASTPSEGTSA